MSRPLPLLNRPGADILARNQEGAVSVADFLGRVARLSDHLPGGGHVLNLCRDRLTFSTVFAATLAAGSTNLLPANRLPGTLDRLLERYPRALPVCDQPQLLADLDSAHLDPGPALDGAPRGHAVPAVAADHPAAIVFTSGSTGPSAAIVKPWRTLYESTLVNAAETGLDTGETGLVATVPPQHMWGLETSVLMPWFAPVGVHSGQPFYVADIAGALEAMPAPRVLISTPVHLRALCESDHPLPPIERIYSATAPLGAGLATRLGEATGASVTEIYGCSETGCLARRDPAGDEPWQSFGAFTLRGDDDGTVASAEHLPEPVRLMDRLEFTHDGRFRLAGRHNDLVNIAGKRASLAELTAALLELPGVDDAVIFRPPEDPDGNVRRLAALVVAPGREASELRRALAEHIDAAFVPRPLKLVERLPRADTGKLPHQAVVELYRQLAPTGS